MKLETKALLDELMIKPSAVFLATTDKEGHPFIRAVFNLRCEERYPKPSKAIREFDNNPYAIYHFSDSPIIFDSLKNPLKYWNIVILLYINIPY